MTIDENPKSWKEHINTKYGLIRSNTREKFELELEVFRRVVLIPEAIKTVIKVTKTPENER